MSSSLLFFIYLFSMATADQFWVTTVLSEFKVRDQCAEFWSQSSACSTPLVRISTNINQPTQFASRTWKINDTRNSTEIPSFISQWHGSAGSIRVSMQIEGSNPLNPFGLVAKCDEGFHPKVLFNHTSDNVMERLSTRVVSINSQCFTAKVLLKVDTVCPYCPTTTTPLPTTFAADSFMYTHRLSIMVILLLITFTTVSVTIFMCTLNRFIQRRRGFKTCPSLESGISTISPMTDSTIISIENKKTEFFDFFALMPPAIDYEEFDLDVSIDSRTLPRLGSLVYEYYPSNLDVSVSDPVFV
ncbi:hypothetical protein L5515_003614 [Caenorhabditis briggsae]|uniref:C2 domain-containing protein n=1 Tax=Caenorhabditis briggsae TaxID=6238 RepID=A0AAE9EML1_CAEBR|nr:hypothetical protein L5515_003614 [Caenorhabditis briggsae]